MNFDIRLALLLCMALACGDDPPGDDGASADLGAADASGGCVALAERLVPCGNCGERTEQCVDGAWASLTECRSEGACAPGTVETEEGPVCATRTRECTATCEWSSWSDGEPGVCEPGESREVSDGCELGEVADETCTDTCDWGEASECRDACGGVRRTAPWYAEERCVPGGTFIRGHESEPDARPPVEAHVSAFYIDRYPVTNARYALCVAAGDCPAVLGSPDATYELQDPARADYPVFSVPSDGVRAFCRFDGGRRLPTEAEWEKAARGPAPRDAALPWDDDPGCDEYPAVGCPGFTGYETTQFPFEVGALPSMESPFGVAMMVGAGTEYVLDHYEADEHASGGAAEDDRLTMEGVPDRNSRGNPLLETPAFFQMQLSKRNTFVVSGEYRSRRVFIRCVRSAPDATRSWEADLPESI